MLELGTGGTNRGRSSKGVLPSVSPIECAWRFASKGDKQFPLRPGAREHQLLVVVAIEANKVVGGRRHVLFPNVFPVFVMDKPKCLETKLLDEAGYVSGSRDKVLGSYPVNHFACARKTVNDKTDALLCGRLVEQNGLSRLVERTDGVGKHLDYAVMASEKEISDIAV